MNRWEKIRDTLLLVIGVVMVIVLSNLNANVHKAEDKAILAIAGHCRVLIALDEPLHENGPCYEKEVKQIWVSLVDEERFP